MSGARAAGGVGVVAGGTLPYTGFSTLWVSLVAAGLLLLGLVLMTAARRPRADG
jgi:LPXTG-motif cell wall-anchored protein